MIFECPHCGRENDVPESELTGLAMVLECRACKAKFRVVPEETAEEVPALEPPPDERTAVENAPPEALVDAQGGAIPSATDFEESDARTFGDGDTEQHTMPIDTSEADLRRLQPSDGGTQSAARPPSALDLSNPDNDAEAEGVKTVLQGPDKGPSERPGRGLEAQRITRPGSSSQITVTPAKSNPDVYARIAQAESVSVVPVQKPASARPLTKAWNEPSVVDRSAASGGGLAFWVNRLGGHLERAPLFLKVWLLVFPLALGLILILSKRPREEPVPIAIPAHSAPEPQRVRVVEAPEPPPAPEGPEAPEPSAPPPAGTETSAPSQGGEPPPTGVESPSLTFEDPTAPAGMAFVRSEGVRLRTNPGAKGKTITSIAAGSLVRVYDDVDDWVLVMVPPRGPAGFVKRDLLDDKKPLSVLARDFAFLGCTSAGTTVSLCVDDAERQRESCLAGCGQNERCERACRLAEEACADACRRR